jgi:hypothetical protein
MLIGNLKKPRIRRWALLPARFVSKKTSQETRLMRTSQHFRAQAQLYSDIAQTLSDPKAAETAEAKPTDCLVKAEEMEQRKRESENQIEIRTRRRSIKLAK